ncbi:GMC family oxidoreductase [Roseiconus nitratireducens]|uniref:GMC family oxidoreductase n=1 Tax=Roseiconus nitratireducens TaxID=2605748 RepID=A0A5M6D374_9BACT|nr:GMC oxidoreductase [Roseiconus nitratireducens]KAA5540742.1 GMC family oxidoreductase [Roseiconus nitratireducens]
MQSKILLNEEVRRGYHSGLSGKANRADRIIPPADRGTQDKRISFETSKYLGGPYKVTLRSSANGWTDLEGEFVDNTRWEFLLPAATYSDTFWMKFVLRDVGAEVEPGDFWMAGDNVEVRADERERHFTDANVFFGYEVKFRTSRWVPNFLVTLRNNVDGWGRDLFGVFAGDAWTFLLDRDLYPEQVQTRFALEMGREISDETFPLQASQQFYEVDDGAVSFPDLPNKYRHGYDNFVSLESRLEQMTVQAIGRPEDEFDVIVIGSGMGGGSLADALSDQGVKVLVLEAGGLHFPVHMNELPRSETSFVGRDQLGHFNNRGEAHFNPGVHFNLGGRSVYWSGLIPRMQPWEFRECWPVVVRDYLLDGGGSESGYEKAEKLMRKRKTLGRYQNKVVDHLNTVLGDSMHAIDLPRSLHQPNLNENLLLENVIERSTGGFSTADLLLDSLGFSDKAGKNFLRVNLHHLVTHLETEGDRVTGVVCQDLVGNVQRRYRASYVVLACGSIESPKLALQSELSDPNEKIGRGLTDHPAYFYTRLHELPRCGDLCWLGDPHGHAKVMLRHNHASSVMHPYNIELLINAEFWDTRHADDDLWRRLVDRGETAQVEIKFIFDSPLNECNQLTFNGEGNKPDVSVALNLHAEGYKQEIVDMRNQVLGALGVTGLTTTYQSEEWSEGIHGSVHHAGGTLRMSDNGTGVVDQNLKFEAYDNLYCCDVSVNPSIPAANPSLTLVALSLRLADKLVERLGIAS